jgi:DNA-binding NarL/FixJ family response regulator
MAKADDPALARISPSLAREANGGRPRLFILSDVCLLREGLTVALANYPSVEVVGASDLSASSTVVAERSPDLLLLDIGGGEGLDRCRPIYQVLPTLKVVAIAVAEVEQDVIACAEAGVSGFVSRTGSVQDVVAAVHGVVRGELVCSPRIAATLFNRIGALASGHCAVSEPKVLTPRERDVASLVSEGRSNKDIARLLRIQTATVKNHIHSILGKLNLERRGQVAVNLTLTAECVRYASMSSAHARRGTRQVRTGASGTDPSIRMLESAGQ